MIKKLNPVFTELFLRGRKINISLVFITQSYFFIAKIPNKREINQIAHLSDINTKDFVNIYRKWTAEPHSFLVHDTTLAPNNPLRFRKNLFNIKCKFPWIQILFNVTPLYNKNHDN